MVFRGYESGIVIRVHSRILRGGINSSGKIPATSIRGTCMLFWTRNLSNSYQPFPHI